MKYKIRMLLFLLSALLAFSACRSLDVSIESTSYTGTDMPEKSEGSVPAEKEPKSNAELFDLVIQSWRTGTYAGLYRYASAELTSLLDMEGFSKLFYNISEPAGDLREVQALSVSTEADLDVYRATLSFAYATVDLRLSLSNVQICGWVCDMRFQDTHEVRSENGVMQRYFVLKSGEYELNAVYTHTDSSEPCPAVLLISGSGPADYNESVGLLAPLKDIALGLAEQKINSLRLEKRTYRYGDLFKETDGIEEEYLTDSRAALTYLKQQPETSTVFLLGHSLGGQIAAILAADDREIQGMVLFNGTARHLADVACDQYSVADPTNHDLYAGYAEEAKKATVESATGNLYYYGTSDVYWATYNTLHIRETLEAAELPTLVINSTYDRQAFAEDLQLWKTIYADKPNVTIRIYDDISHFGYKIDSSDPSAVYTAQQFPDELLAEFVAFFVMQS